MLFQKHIHKNHISKFNNFDEMLFSLVERIITLSQIEPSYNFFLPFILTHIFTEFLTKSYEEEYISRKNHRRPNILFENREISFTSIARLTTNHHKSNTKYINNEQYYVKDSNPVVDFMEDAIYTFFNPSSFFNKDHFNNETLEKYVTLTQANWLAFYLENNRVYFENNTICGEKCGYFLSHYLEIIFSSDDKTKCLSFDYSWIRTFYALNGKKFKIKDQIKSFDIISDTIGFDDESPSNLYSLVRKMVADYYNDPKLWERGALQAKSPENELYLGFINLLIQSIQENTGLKAKDAGLLTRQALLSVFLTPILSELEEYLNELYGLRKQLNLFLDLHIYEQGEILTEY